MPGFVAGGYPACSSPIYVDGYTLSCRFSEPTDLVTSRSAVSALVSLAMASELW